MPCAPTDENSKHMLVAAYACILSWVPSSKPAFFNMKQYLMLTACSSKSDQSWLTLAGMPLSRDVLIS